MQGISYLYRDESHGRTVCSDQGSCQQSVHSPQFHFYYNNYNIIKMAVTCKVFLALAFLTVLVKAQRPFYAGLSAIGVPEVESDSLSNRFGDDDPVPIEVKGDKKSADRINALPLDNRPFWYINWKAYEDLRKRPQTYPLRPNPFLDN